MADHWRTPRTRNVAAYASGAIVGPLVAVLFVVAVMWIVGRLA